MVLEKVKVNRMINALCQDLFQSKFGLPEISIGKKTRLSGLVGRVGFCYSSS